MRTSLIETRHIEHFLQGELSMDEALLTEVRMSLDDEFKEKVELQQEVTRLVHTYGRKQLQADIDKVHNRLFSEPSQSRFKKES